MAPPASDTYGRLRRAIEQLRPAADDHQRDVFWTDDATRHLGVARDGSGRIEIFITGPALAPTSSVIAKNLEHDKWRRRNAESLTANRLRLPAAPHFDAVAAFLCTELIGNGVLVDAQQGLQRSEPVIEMAIARLTMQDEVLVGLLGELIVMTGLLDRAPPTRAQGVLESWHGHVRSTRDFQLGSVGVEIKTTRGSTSSHKVQGVRQIELGHSVGAVYETNLYLVSIGVEMVAANAPSANAWSLPKLVDGLIDRINRLVPADAEELTASLLSQVRGYGGGEGRGYDHNEMKHRVIFGYQWQTTFFRSYDMTDPGIKTLRTPNLVEFNMVDPDSVEFVLKLPKQIQGDLNPIVGLAKAADTFIATAWGG